MKPIVPPKIGERFTRLTIVDVLPSTGRGVRVKCRCDCGNEICVFGHYVLSGNTKSCGCLRRDACIEGNLIHGKSSTRAYGIWRGMIRRCTDPTHHSFKNYGGRGIVVCDSWKRFETFYKDMGDPPPRHTLERIDNGRGYSPDNCKWATTAEQSRNTRATVLVTFCGATKCMADWSRELGIDARTLQARFRLGWPIERAMTERVHRRYPAKPTVNVPKSANAREGKR